MEEKKLPVYETPEVISYSDQRILEQLGPARAGNSTGFLTSGGSAL